MGLGDPDLRRVCVMGRSLYSIVIFVGVRKGGRETLTFRGCRGGGGRGCRVGDRDWAWGSGKVLELLDFGVALQRYIALCA